MSSANPVSPKVIAAGIGSIVAPILFTVAAYIIDLFLNGSIVLPEPWDKVALVVATAAGAVIASYRKTDGLRIPTIDDEAVAKLDQPEPVA
jgi:hypothetical protein